MKYIKYFKEKLLEELTLDRNLNVETEEKLSHKNGKKLYEYQFRLSKLLFSTHFAQITNENYECSYGAIDDGELSDNELNLSINDTLDLTHTISNIIISFLNKYNPNIVLLNHKDMNNEYEVPSNKLNKRANILFKYLKGKIPNIYVISYWSNNQIFQNSDSKASTTCIISKKEADISTLIKLKDNINVS